MENSVDCAEIDLLNIVGAIDASGNVSLKFSHASEYAVVITDTTQTTEDQNPDSKPNNNQTTNGDQQNNLPK